MAIQKLHVSTYNLLSNRLKEAAEVTVVQSVARPMMILSSGHNDRRNRRPTIFYWSTFTEPTYTYWSL